MVRKDETIESVRQFITLNRINNIPKSIHRRFTFHSTALDAFPSIINRKSRKQSLSWVSPAQLRLLLQDLKQCTENSSSVTTSLTYRQTALLHLSACVQNAPSEVSLFLVYFRIFCHDDTVCSHLTQHRERLKSLPQDVYIHISEYFYGKSGMNAHSGSLIRPADHCSKRPYIIQLFLFAKYQQQIMIIGLVELRTGTTQKLYIVQSLKINLRIHPYIELEWLANVQHLPFRMQLSRSRTFQEESILIATGNRASF